MARTKMIVQYTNQDDANWLRCGARYTVQAVYFDRQQGVRYRIMSDDAATPALFPATEFTLIDGTMPDSWIAFVHSNGEFELSPPAWVEPGFWARYFDGDAEAIRVFASNTQPASMT
jgi:hypothetical protein